MTHINVLQFGVGGTGSYLAVPLKKFLASLEGPYKSINYYLVDGDEVEEKNTKRQNFTSDDIGSNKAECFAGYIGEAVPYFLNESNFNLFLNNLAGWDADENINIIIGCTDTIEARSNIIKLIEMYFERGYNRENTKTFYIDSGNFISTGQTVVFDYQKNTLEEIRKKFEEIFVNNPDAVAMDKAPSCTDNGDQTIAANFQAASVLYNVVTEILSYGDTSVRKIGFLRYSRELDYDIQYQLKRSCI